jgi:hypothetical protein
MQKRGRPPARIPTEQVTVRLPRAMLDQFRRGGRGVSAEIQERLFRSLFDDARDENILLFAGKIEQLAKDVHGALGAHWYEDEKAHHVFIETVKRLFADLPVPSAQISKSPVDAKTAADLLYNRYVAVIQDYEAGAKPKIREPISHLLEKKS